MSGRLQLDGASSAAGHERRATTASGRSMLGQIPRFLALVALVVLFGILLVLALTFVQGGRDERRNVDALIVLGDQADAQLVDHAFDLYRRGFASRIVLGGAAADDYRSALLDRGIPDAAIVGDVQAEDAGLLLAELAQTARAAGIDSALIVGHQAHMLRDIKIARDHGMRVLALHCRAPLPMSSRSWRQALPIGATCYWGGDTNYRNGNSTRTASTAPTTELMKFTRSLFSQRQPRR
ncbi:YdcF family protein [Candidatus Gracilibacteria bacterium]|nr:YdcF family protein [Candidatus Gracilibacteria bacterium]